MVRFLPSILFLHLPELAVRFCNSSGQAAGFGNVLFGIRRSRESDNRLEAKIDRLLSEEIDQAQFGYQEEEEVQGCGLTAKPTLNA